MEFRQIDVDWDYEYDAFGRTIRAAMAQTLLSGLEDDNCEDASGPETVTDSGWTDRVYTYLYDGFGRVVRSSFPDEAGNSITHYHAFNDQRKIASRSLSTSDSAGGFWELFRNGDTGQPDKFERGMVSGGNTTSFQGTNIYDVFGNLVQNNAGPRPPTGQTHTEYAFADVIRQFTATGHQLPIDDGGFYPPEDPEEEDGGEVACMPEYEEDISESRPKAECVCKAEPEKCFVSLGISEVARKLYEKVLPTSGLLSGVAAGRS
jgi:hypothetical protein